MQLNPPSTDAAFGTSPPWIRNDHLLPGTTFEQIIKLSRNETDRVMEAKLRIDGDKDLLKWLKIEDQDNLIMKKGEKVLPMKVTIKVPKRATLKDYRGGIFVTLQSVADESGGQGGNVAIKLGAHILIEVSVIGDKVVDYRVKSITTDVIEEGDTYHINAEVENLGNTELTELNGQIDIYDKKETEILKSLTFGTLDPLIEPDQILKSRVNISDFDLGPGEYWIVVKVFKEDKVIYENRLYQKINASSIPIITPEDVGVKKPSIPKADSENIENTTETPAEVVQPETETAPAAVAPQDDLRPVAQPLGDSTNNLFVIFGIAGLVFGLVSLVSIVILLIVLIRNQRQTLIQRYLAEQQKLHIK